MKTINDYLKESLLDDEENLLNDDSMEIMDFLKENYRIAGKIDIHDNIVDVKGNLTVKNKDITELTNGKFEFGKVTMSFDCSECDKLTTLKGAPREVGEDFDCMACSNLKSFEGGPDKVDMFIAEYCMSIKDLTGCPKKIRNLLVSGTNITSLKGSPSKIKELVCSYCGELTNLKYAPSEIFWINITGCSNLTDIKDLKKVKEISWEDTPASEDLEMIKYVQEKLKAEIMSAI